MSTNNIYYLSINHPYSHKNTYAFNIQAKLQNIFLDFWQVQDFFCALSLHFSRLCLSSEPTQYPFVDSNVSLMFDELLKFNLIDLLEKRQPHEISKVDDLNYYKYHRLVGHTIKKCFAFKDKVMRLDRDGRIELEDATTSTKSSSYLEKLFH